MYTLPQPKYTIKLLSKFSSRICWVIIKLNLTASPVLVVDLKIWTLKQPSASTNPTNHFALITLPVLLQVLKEEWNLYYFLVKLFLSH